MEKRTIALTTVGVLVAGPAALLVTAPAAQADVDRGGVCGGGRYELSVDREDGGYEVSVDLDRVAPGTRWRVVVRHDGKRIASVVRTADREGDVDVERVVRGTPGSETFRFTAKRVGTRTACGATVTVA
ncbi:hypothetical protein [Nocardioides sp.]|uniref:hypothetical protein n=1 Tax=Nocardioides sp. TaxID=35761 RepID=UPI00271E4DB4|nr:hypothetical protein [Nocardioides sp.]MDO9456805.1 hypothetical protein [Nocardioides sp.]